MYCNIRGYQPASYPEAPLGSGLLLVLSVAPSLVHATPCLCIPRRLKTPADDDKGGKGVTVAYRLLDCDRPLNDILTLSTRAPTNQNPPVARIYVHMVYDHLRCVLESTVG